MNGYEMTKREKISFVRAITKSIANELIEKIKSGKVPAEWNGHQLRFLLADKFEHERTSLMRRDRKARKSYWSDVYNNNL